MFVECRGRTRSAGKRSPISLAILTLTALAQALISSRTLNGALLADLPVRGPS
jgi:hypothetical protein